MSKKDFELVAEVIRTFEVEAYLSWPSGPSGQAIRERLASDFADAFENVNPKFDEVKFLNYVLDEARSVSVSVTCASPGDPLEVLSNRFLVGQYLDRTASAGYTERVMEWYDEGAVEPLALANGDTPDTWYRTPDKRVTDSLWVSSAS